MLTCTSPYIQAVLSFGVFTALWLFTCKTKPVVVFLHLYQAVELRRQQLNITLKLLTQLGCELSKVRPSTSLEDRWVNIQSYLLTVIHKQTWFNQWQVLLGQLITPQELTVRGRLQLRPIQRFPRPFLDLPDHKLRPPQWLKRYLHWWTIKSNVWGGTFLIYCDWRCRWHPSNWT